MRGEIALRMLPKQGFLRRLVHYVSQGRAILIRFHEAIPTLWTAELLTPGALSK